MSNDKIRGVKILQEIPLHLKLCSNLLSNSTGGSLDLEAEKS